MGLVSDRSSLAGTSGIGGLLAIQDANGTTTGENHEFDDLPISKR